MNYHVRQSLHTLFGAAMMFSGVALVYALIIAVHNLLFASGGDSGGATLIVLAIVAVALYIYFIPTIVAWKRNHPDKRAVLVINMLLGWCLIGWVVAMVWAVKSIRVDYQYR
jgi:4-hydroxybenzoate polyprenyltransferase